MQKWLTAKGSGGGGPSKVEKEEYIVKEENIPGPRVRKLKDKFEKGGRTPRQDKRTE